jgi:DNA modification methylase
MPVISQKVTENYAVYHSDCMELLPSLKRESVDISVYSPPFPELYQYSNDPRDMTNCVSYQESIDQYRFIVREIARVTKPGRMTAVHCQDLKWGQLYKRDFPGDIIRIHEEMNMGFFSRITIWKDPWFVARRTRLRALMHKMIVQDASCCQICQPDIVLVFRKRGDNAVPIEHKHGFKTYAGGEQIPQDLVRDYANYKGDQRKNLMSHWIWRHYASPVWMDIRRRRALPHRDTKEKPEEKHVCPLQLDVIERCIALWSNPRDVLLTPFLGVGSEAYMAMRMDRKAIGCELKETYYRQAVKNIDAALRMDFQEDVSEDIEEDDVDGGDGDENDNNLDGDEMGAPTSSPMKLAEME